jgi:hypothetical protein
MKISRESILSFKMEPRIYESELFGGEIEYRVATVGDRIRSRMLATEGGELKVDKLEAALIIACCIEPKFSDSDMDFVMGLPSAEVQKLASLILSVGKTGSNP